MAQKLTDGIVRKLEAPATGNRITYDSKVSGLGVRVTAGGARSWILNYRTRGGRERRYTIGSCKDFSTDAAREEASDLKAKIRQGGDPLEEIRADREAPTVAELCRRFAEEFLSEPASEERARLRKSTRETYRATIDLTIKPELGSMKVADVSFSDIDRLHRKITTKRGTPYQANRAVALLSRMFNLAIRWQWCTANPAKGIERNHEEKRHRYLSPEELTRLTSALAEHEDQQAANIVRLLLLTGARRREVMAAKWEQFDLEAGVWTKPGSTTKQRTLHRVPLSAPARQLLADVRAQAEADAKKQKGRGVSEYVFPGRSRGHRVGITSDWYALCKAAGITSSRTVKGRNGKTRTETKHSARIHDLRHTYASTLASAGFSLPIIGALLGHSQAQTTARYSHLFDDPLRVATERVGAVMSNAGKAGTGNVVPLRGRSA